MPPGLYALRRLVPSWFTTSMATGIVAVSLRNSPHRFAAMDTIADVVFVGNVILFIVLAILTAARHFLFPGTLKILLSDGQQSMFLGASAMALGTIVQGLVSIVQPKYGQWVATLTWVLWWIQVAASCLSVVVIPMAMFTVQTLAQSSMTATWLLPVLPLLVTAVSGSWVATIQGPTHANATILVSYVAWGSGFGLSMCLLALYVQRLLTCHLPSSEVIVSSFITLSPFAQASVAIVRLAEAGSTNFQAVHPGSLDGSGLVASSAVVGLTIWGFGLWWLVHGTLSVVLRARDGSVSFSMGFWSVVFPLGVYSSSTSELSQVFISPFLAWVSTVLVAVTVLVWLFVIACTIYAAFQDHKRLAEGPCLSGKDD